MVDYSVLARGREREARVQARIPLGCVSEPDEQAAVTFLTSDAASFVNGAIVDVNGGLL